MRSESQSGLDIPTCGFYVLVYLRRNCIIGLMPNSSALIVAVTGAHGVGKSTFCRELVHRLHKAGYSQARLLDGLGDRVRAMGIPLGSTSTPDTIFAIWASHLEREAAITDELVILDRCMVDALAYTRALNLTSGLAERVLEQTAQLAAGRLRLVIHLELSPFFEGKGAAHETAELRERVASEIPIVLAQLGSPSFDLDASAPGSLDRAVETIVRMVGGG